MEKLLLLWLRRIGGSLFGIGYIPVVGLQLTTLVVPLVLFLYQEQITPFLVPQYSYLYFLVIAVLGIVSMCLAEDGKNVFNREEAPQAVFPGIVGQLTVYFLLPMTWRVLLLGYVLYQFYIIVKPYPIYRFTEMEGGIGITMSHIMAGVLSNVTLFAVLQLFGVINDYLQ